MPRATVFLAWLLLAPVLLTMAVPAPAEDWSEGAVVAAYLYNFAKFVEWPRSTWTAVDQPLVIGVFGPADFTAELETHLHGRTVQGHPVMVWHMSEESHLRGCHLLWIQELPNDLTESAVLDSLRGMPVLTIGRGIDFARRGGMIGLYLESDRLRFAINQGAASHGGLKISSKLLALAQRLEPEGAR